MIKKESQYNRWLSSKPKLPRRLDARQDSIVACEWQSRLSGGIPSPRIAGRSTALLAGGVLSMYLCAGCRAARVGGAPGYPSLPLLVSAYSPRGHGNLTLGLAKYRARHLT